MRFLVVITLAALGFHALAQSEAVPGSSSTALGALKLVPKDQAGNLVAIHAREGNPVPDRWYFLTYDPAAESGVHEFVVVGNRLVASRGLSQFAQAIKPNEVMVKSQLQVDSDKAGQIAFDYAQANGVTIDSVNYQLNREGHGKAVWKLVCLNQSSQRLGELKIDADNGAVIRHDGFAVEPKPTPIPIRVAEAVTPPASPAPAAASSLIQAGTAQFVGVAYPSPTPPPMPKSTPKKREEPKGLGGKLKRYFILN